MFAFDLLLNGLKADAVAALRKRPLPLLRELLLPGKLPLLAATTEKDDDDVAPPPLPSSVVRWCCWLWWWPAEMKASEVSVLL